jgi:hypothetical protein
MSTQYSSDEPEQPGERGLGCSNPDHSMEYHQPNFELPAQFPGNRPAISFGPQIAAEVATWVRDA